jgi:hypothetical protein
MRRCLSILLLLIASAGHATPAVPDAISADEYSVYSALINTRFLRGKTNLAVIDARTQLHFNNAVVPKEFDELLAKNEKTYILARRFRLRVKYLLLGDDQLDFLFKPDPKDWDIYWKRYPRATGLLAFSRVGFNARRNKAFVYASEICGPLCGYGYSFLLVKENGVWKLKEENQLWIS